MNQSRQIIHELAAVEDYNGWSNHETWNVALWIGNDEGLYNIARRCKSYGEFQDRMRELGSRKTDDGVAWDDPNLDMKELDDMIRELSEGKRTRGAAKRHMNAV